MRNGSLWKRLERIEQAISLHRRSMYVRQIPHDWGETDSPQMKAALAAVLAPYDVRDTDLVVQLKGAPSDQSKLLYICPMYFAVC